MQFIRSMPNGCPSYNRPTAPPCQLFITLQQHLQSPWGHRGLGAGSSRHVMLHLRGSDVRRSKSEIWEHRARGGAPGRRTSRIASGVLFGKRRVICGTHEEARGGRRCTELCDSGFGRLRRACQEGAWLAFWCAL